MKSWRKPAPMKEALRSMFIYALVIGLSYAGGQFVTQAFSFASKDNSDTDTSLNWWGVVVASIASLASTFVVQFVIYVALGCHFKIGCAVDSPFKS
jgi:hypothetical protein